MENPDPQQDREPQDSSAPDEDVVREEEEAAAAEAARIGGRGGADHVEDEAERPLAEGGGGEAEGFEQAEHDLVENATSLDSPNPETHAGQPEAERSEAEYGEPDEVEVSEADDDA
jgi:hypothetical protein